MDESITAALEAFRNRKIYSRLDPKILASIADEDVEQAVIDYVFSKVEGQSDEERKVIDALPPGSRALYLTWIVEAEVNNGGFNQYYWNTEDEFADDAVQAFRFFGAEQHAALMEEANSVRRQETAAIAEFKNRGTVEAFSESYEVSKLDPLDQRFYQLTDNLSTRRISKIRAAPEFFSGK